MYLGFGFRESRGCSGTLLRSGEAGWLTLLRMGSLEYMILDANPTRRHPSSFYSSLKLVDSLDPPDQMKFR
jgi:hypothetical protein